MDDNASPIARPSPSSINTIPASGKEDGSGNIGIGIISMQVPKDSGNGLEYMLISKSKEGGTKAGAGTIEWIGRPPYLEAIQQTRSN
jgi:hypothetical protein